MKPLVLVVGTGTEVGKTHVTRALSLASGAPAYKPVTSGGNEDVERLGSAPPLYALGSPISVHLAARRDGVHVGSSAIVLAIGERARDLPLLFVETAGGLYSPLSDTETNADVARLLGDRADVVLVAPDRLGVLHDCGAAIRAARADGLVIRCVALSAPAVADASTGANAEELRRLGLAREVVTFPRTTPEDLASREAARACLRALGRV